MKQKLFWGILAVGYLLLCINSVNIGGDFDVYLHAAEKLSRGENIYDPPFLNGLKYYYSPFFALALTPFCQQPFAIELFWLILLGGMMLRVWQLIKYQFDTNIFSQRTLYLWTLLSFFFALRFWLYNVAMIQVTIFLLWAMMESVHQLNKGRNIQAAGLLALAINVKILPIVLLPYWLYRGRVKAVGWLCGFSMLLLYLPSLFLGQEQNAFLLAEWWEVINPMNGEHLIETETNAQSLVGLIPAYFKTQ
ncbi:MAG: glycosyltransferase family 87 protein [Bacteroidota bacterium]